MSTTAKALTELEIRNREKSIELIKKCIPVIQKFDGKVVNKRLETALRNACDGVIITVKKGAVRPIEYYASDRYVKNDGYGVSYISYPYYDLIDVCRDFVGESGRLNGSSAVSAMEVQIQYYLDDIQRYRDALEHIEETIERMHQLEEELRAVRHSVPASMQKYFNID